MRKTLFRTLATALLISGTIFAQQQDKPAKQALSNSTKPLVVTGRVSSDGRTLLTDIDSEWTVMNSEMLKGNEGHVVKVKCYVDTERNRIQILSVKRDENGSNYSATHADSAFRR